MSTPGTISWADLTVPDATAVRDFYQAVVGWAVSDVEMGGYSDFAMHPEPGGPMVAGICHARGGNADLPPVWLVYITVTDLDASLAAGAAGGGSILGGARSAGPGARYAIIRDPAGAACALFERTTPA